MTHKIRIGDLVRYIASGDLNDRLFLVLYAFPSGISCFCSDEDLPRRRYLFLPYELQVISKGGA
jgi:hypothetical protein